MNSSPRDVTEQAERFAQSDSERAPTRPGPPSRPRARWFVVCAGVCLFIGGATALALPAAATTRESLRPEVVSVRARSLAASPKGASVMVRARVSNATSCRLELVNPHAVRLSFSRHWRQCSTGSFTERIRFRANLAHPSARRVVFRLVARNRSAGLVTHRVVIHFRVRDRGASRLAKAATL